MERGVSFDEPKKWNVNDLQPPPLLSEDVINETENKELCNLIELLQWQLL